jgi:hypothetical protein
MESPCPQSPQAVILTYVPPWMLEGSKFWSYPDTIDVYAISRDFFGLNESLPDEYKFAFVPRNATILELSESNSAKLSYSYSVFKGAAALLQAVYAIFTLYNSRGNQINRYGYAAFGLTVVPYAVMSVLNLIANMVTPNYSTLYLVQSEVMKEAEQRKGLRFGNVVGRLQTFKDSLDTEYTIGPGWRNAVGYLKSDDVLRLPSVSPPGTQQKEDLHVLTTIPDEGRHLSLYVPACPRFHRTDNIHETTVTYKNLKRSFKFVERTPQSWPDFNSGLLFYVVCGIEVAIIGGLSGFRKGESTQPQRVWTMTWLAFGCLLGYVIHAVRQELYTELEDVREGTWSVTQARLMKVTMMLLYCAPSVGGFVVVGQMMKAYGSCLRLN